MIISLIAAVDLDGGIGKDGRVPWHLSADLKRFKELTWGHHLLMGRITHASIGRVLPGRTSLVVTRQAHYPLIKSENLLRMPSLEAALAFAKAQHETELFVIGGGKIYAQALPLADRLYLTFVQTQAGCDVFFPPFDRSQWTEVSSTHHPADAGNDYPSIFTVFRKNG